MNHVVRAEIPATVATVAVEAGQQVGESDVVVQLESVTSEVPVPAGVAGIVMEVLVSDGDVVEVGDPLLAIAEDS
ncbi:biotin/lipoyl-containing protein [Tessaracoccus palaemonis]|uniref:Biotin/lipoyl-binding protein n=1 Tax=Tessaracoccus palaemonis TaxID=2829499 RepID=A0ABX8SKZ3_9ACTN|nr:biotin/lipoyl-containing protein [Tessaracoccus palaemonis]QXT63559.1 biotin/lipoyl-binding protein [Tessaracoccus palaemonis]